jgi:outer membrane receptor for ferrienterochelin and colicin
MDMSERGNESGSAFHWMKQVLKGAILSLLLVSLAQGQVTREGKGTYLIDPVLVTATKDLQPEKAATQKVDVVYDEEFNQYVFPNRNISEILKYQPGNFVNPLSRNDANWGSYGGLGPKYNVQLLDGLPIDSFVDDMSLVLPSGKRGGFPLLLGREL